MSILESCMQNEENERHEWILLACWGPECMFGNKHSKFELPGKHSYARSCYFVDSVQGERILCHSLLQDWPDS